MSKDVIRPLLKAVADLPDYHTGLVLNVVNALRGQNSTEVAERLKDALTPVAKAVRVTTPTPTPVGELITRTAAVDRTRTPKEAMLATGRTPYLNDTAVANMPRGTDEAVTMSFLCFGRYIACDKLEEELDNFGLELVVDPIGQAAVNEADPEFADTHPNGTQWVDADGKFCYALFDRWHDERLVYVRQNARDWHDRWWFPVRSK